MPPRTLKAPIGVWFSCLTHTSAPVRFASSGQACCGVGGTMVPTSATAASRSVSEKSDIARVPMVPMDLGLSIHERAETARGAGSRRVKPPGRDRLSS